MTKQELTRWTPNFHSMYMQESASGAYVEHEALTAAQARIEKLERMVVWGVEKDCRLVNRHVWQIDAGYIECDGTHASILAAVEKAMATAAPPPERTHRAPESSAAPIPTPRR